MVGVSTPGAGDAPARPGDDAGAGGSLDAKLLIASHRLNQMMELVLALSNARTHEQTLKVVVDRGMRAAAADTCAVYWLDKTGTALELVEYRGVAADLAAQVRRFTADSHPDMFASFCAGKSIWVKSREQYAKMLPDLAGAKSEGPRARAFWSIPLIVEDRLIGILGMGFLQDRPFLPDERAFVLTLTNQCSQALGRAVRLEREEKVNAQLLTTLHSIGDAVIVTDSQGRITLINPVAQALTGWTAADATGQKLEDVFVVRAEDPAVSIENPATKVLREKAAASFTVPTVLRTKSGASLAIDDSAAPIRDLDGDLLGVVIVFRDVSRQRALRIRNEFLEKAGQALMSSLDYRVTLARVAQLAVPEIADWCTIEILEPGDKVPQQLAVAHVDPAKVAYAKELAAKYPPDQNAVTGISQVIRSGVSELYSEIAPELLEQSAVDAEHLAVLRELKLRSVMIVPLLGRDRTLGAVTFIRGESGRNYTLADLAFAEEFARRSGLAIENAYSFRRAEEAARARENVVSIVSHDLRSPLSSVLMAARLIELQTTAAESSPVTKKALAGIVRGVDRMTRLTNDLLDLAKIEAGQPLPVEIETRNCLVIVREAVESSEPLARARQITLKGDLDVAPLMVRCDPERVQQVLANLIGNAIKFTPAGGAISAAARHASGEIIVSVSDTGTGIRPEETAHLFEPYWQANAQKKGGIGLGLSIAKAIIDAHGGRIWVDTEIGKGTTFHFTLPPADPEGSDVAFADRPRA